MNLQATWMTPLRRRAPDVPIFARTQKEKRLETKMRKLLFMTVVTPLFALVVHSQQYPSEYPSTPGDPLQQLQQQGQTSGVDCSDPSQATSPQCAGGRGISMTPGSMPGSTSAEVLSSQPGHVPTYNDESTRTGYPRRFAQNPLPRPEPLTEFQKFIVATTGQVLPVYGANLFENVPSTFAPLESSPVPPDYVLGPDDELRIRVWGQVNFNANLRVDRAGDVFLPQIGQVHVAGLRFNEVQQHIHDAVGRVYRNFQLEVEMGQIRSIQVYVTGEARRPGVYTVSSLASLIDALFASGGPSVQGSMRRIDLRRGGQLVTTLDLYALLVSGDKSSDAKLLSGDVIFIPSVGSQVAIIGSVRRPAIYELLPGEPLDRLLHDAGGVTALASEARASLERTVEHSGRTAMEIRLDAAGLATPLQDGDIVHVLSMVSKFEKTVTLRGNTANPGRFAWRQGMRLSDLIPDRDSLLTRDYWWKRAQLGLPAPEFEPAPTLAGMHQPSSPVDLRQAEQDQRQAANAQQFANGQQPANGESPANTQPMDAAAAASTYAPGGQQGETPNMQGGPTANSLQRNAGQRANQSALAEEDTEGNETLTPRSPRRTVVRLSVPEIDWSYAVIDRIDPSTLKTTLIPFDLGKLVIDHDQSQDLPLQPGDVVTVFSQSDIHVPIAEQTTFVRLEGEFVHAGTYSVLPGDTLRSLVERAGGLTPNAYLYGSVFTRESTRILQQRRIDESVHELMMQMQRGNLALAASPVTNAQDLASVNAAQTSEQALLVQLQQIRATGRIVFQFTPNSQGTTAVPNMKLENGDTFLLPSVPSTVNVLGAVFNQNSFVYQPDGAVRGFLNLAGGPNSNADRKRMFVVRANGSVVSRTVVKGGPWGENFFHLKLYPGDTIVVPEKTIKPSALRGVLDWTQIFSQLAFGAAAINVLR
jgi:protein involved in polysaccharide export with SLBB domain